MAKLPSPTRPLPPLEPSEVKTIVSGSKWWRVYAAGGDFFTASASIVCLDLSGAWPTRAGASQAISTGLRDTARLWSQAIYEYYPHIQGVLDPSSVYGGGASVALYERGAALFPNRPGINRPLVDPGLDPLLRNVASQIGYVIV